MGRLNTAPAFDAPDTFYESLIEAHRDLSTAQSHAMNTALVLLLANHIGDLEVISQALAYARAAIDDDTAHQEATS